MVKKLKILKFLFYLCFPAILTFIGCCMSPDQHLELAGHKMVYVGANRIIAFGGLQSDSNNPSNETFQYYTSTKAWAKLDIQGAKPEARYGFSLTYIGSNKIVLFGGHDFPDDGKSYNDMWILNLSTNKWSDISQSYRPSPRRGHGMIFYPDENKLILYGGYVYNLDNNTTDYVSNDLWAYNISSNSWSQISSYNKSAAPARPLSANMGFTYTTNGIAYLYGGWKNSTDYIYKIDCTNYSITPISQASSGKPLAKNNASLLSDGDNTLYWFGGEDDESVFSSDFFKYNITTNTWTKITYSEKDKSPDSRCNFASIYVPGNLYYFGGNKEGSDFSKFSEMWEYHIDTSLWELKVVSYDGNF